MSDFHRLCPSLRWLCILFALLPTTACVSLDSDTESGTEKGTETGNPPVLDGNLLFLRVHGDTMQISGKPGAILPGGSQLVIFDLRNNTVIDTIITAADGSFSVEVGKDVRPAVRAENEYGRSSEEPVPVPVPQVVGPQQPAPTIDGGPTATAIGQPLTEARDAAAAVVQDAGAPVAQGAGLPIAEGAGATVAQDAGAPLAQDTGMPIAEDAAAAAAPDGGAAVPPDAGAPTLSDAGATTVSDSGAARPSIPDFSSIPNGPTVISTDRM